MADTLNFQAARPFEFNGTHYAAGDAWPLPEGWAFKESDGNSSLFEHGAEQRSMLAVVPVEPPVDLEDEPEGEEEDQAPDKPAPKHRAAKKTKKG